MIHGDRSLSNEPGARDYAASRLWCRARQRSRAHLARPALLPQSRCRPPSISLDAIRRTDQRAGNERLSSARAPPRQTCASAGRRCRGAAFSSTGHRGSTSATSAASDTSASRWKAAEKPPSAPDPDPPSTEDAARIVAAAWAEDDDGGMFVWLTLVTGARRGGLLALRWDSWPLSPRRAVPRRGRAARSGPGCSGRAWPGSRRRGS